MKKLLLFTFLFLSKFIFAQTVFINEIHYDNAGGDVNEGWEIAGPAGADLSCYDIILYNGSNGQSYYTETLSGLIDDEGCGYGAVGFSYAGIQNGGPDGIALYNTCTSTLVQFLSYEGSFTATNGVANGVTSTNIGVAENSSTAVGNSLQLTGVGTTYTDFTWQSPNTASSGSVNSGQDFCSCTGPVAEPSIEATNLTTTPACFSVDLSWINGDAANVIVVISETSVTGNPVDGTAYSANSGFGLGSTIATNEYVVYNGSGTSVTITNLNMNTTYEIKIFGYNGALANCEENYLTGGVTISFTTLNNCATTSPQISSILYNSCNGSNEGTDEIFTFSTGNNALPIDSLSIDYPGTAPTYCNVGCGTNTNLNNSTYVNQLNALAGCTVFAYADPIPPNSEVMVFAGNPPSTVLDYSSQCSASNLPIYVVFNNNTSTSGRFCNGCSTNRTLIVNFGNGEADTVSYIATSQAVQDGATVNFDAAGNPTYFISSNCVYPLPIELGKFYLENNKESTAIYWTTLSETKCDYFEVQKSSDGINFNTIGKINATGNSIREVNYKFTDSKVNDGVSYYRLKQVDFDGKHEYSYPISTIHDNTSIFYSNNLIYLNIPKAKINQTYVVNIYNLSGQLIKTDYTNGNNTINWSSKGLFIIEIPELEIRQKIASF